MANLWARTVRFGFFLLYNQFAFTYDLVSKAVSMGQWRCWQRAALGHLNAQAGDPVLELAFGTGDLHIDLNAAGYRTFGHDLSPYMLRIASAKLRRHRLTPRLTRGMAQALPYASSTFAAVVSTFPSEFILHPDTLRDIHRVLRPDGRLVIVPNAVLTGNSATEAGIEWLYRATGQRSSGDEQPQAVNRLLAPYGFETQVMQEPCKNSLATVIVATKQASA
jgi:ubiquinone/menaquinone biosynthesis C-methylase UbiE